jgi:ribulose-5-phosphate 4-epimerase/fuculose-1-phosphate aldolase
MKIPPSPPTAPPMVKPKAALVISCQRGAPVMSNSSELRHDLAIANRILAREGVVDAYGHVSLRQPDASDRFLLSRSRSPELVAPGDIMEFGLDGEVTDKADSRGPYLERYIHAGIYAARPDVAAVVHNHSPAVVPFTVTATPMRPLIHVAGLMGADVPLWDIRDRFGDTNLLVANIDQGSDLALSLGAATTILMRGHGVTIAAASLKEAVITAVYVQLNAVLQMDAMRLGTVKYLSDGEVKLTREMTLLPNVTNRVWDYLTSRADLRGI